MHERLARYPDLHVYHYAPYEITALKRLMGRYGTRERELDDLLRREVFVDLYRIVRNGIRASRPGYGLKELEAFLPFQRQAEVKDGAASIVIFEQWMQTRDDSLLRQIDEYNREDCIATRLLRDWLLERRDEALAQFGPFPLPEPVEPKPIPEVKVERAALRAQLLDAGEELAAQLLDYHDRERKPIWWAFFDRIEMTPAELVEDAESIGRTELVSGPEPVKKSQAYVLSYPAQEHKIRHGQNVIDPATRDSAGEVTEVDREARRLVLKRGPSLEDVPLPEGLIPGSPYLTRDQEDALMRLGRSLLAGDRRYPALETILRREPFDRPVQTSDLDEMKELVLTLDERHLVIQGPPGSGKTWTSGRLIAHLMANGKRVGVASTSHKAIHNLLDAVEDAAAELGLDYRGLKKASSGNPESQYASAHIESVETSAACVDCELAAGTAWLFSDPDHEGTLDYLFVDEAGQVSLADALAMGTAARNVVLVGDPQQLDQVIQGTHPFGSGSSVLRHLLGDEATVPPDRGLFLERTYRLHPDICDYISEEFYEGRLEPAPVAAGRTTPLGTGLRYLPVEHEGHRQESEEEVAVVRAEIERLRAAGITDVIVVSPFNAQVNALQEALPGIRVGTVDKFQGQEADVVIYSMGSSSGEDVPRGLEFLLSRNRLNVAISRARCLAYLVASPRLLEVNCRSIPQMRLANALCRFVELAEIALDTGRTPRYIWHVIKSEAVKRGMWVRKRPSLRMLADRPLEGAPYDYLGFDKYAEALAELIDNEETATPLTMSISAPWGAGKTSLAELLELRLYERARERRSRDTRDGVVQRLAPRRRASPRRSVRRGCCADRVASPPDVAPAAAAASWCDARALRAVATPPAARRSARRRGAGARDARAGSSRAPRTGSLGQARPRLVLRQRRFDPRRCGRGSGPGREAARVRPLDGPVRGRSAERSGSWSDGRCVEATRKFVEAGFARPPDRHLRGRPRAVPATSGGGGV